MKRWFFGVALLAGLLALAACAAEEKAAPAPAAPAAAPAAQPGWEQEWERVLAAAKREGRVAMMGPSGEVERRALTGPFERKYGITVEYLGGRGPEFVPRLQTERAAGQYLWDISFGGFTHWVPYIDTGWVDPIEPTLILPEVKDPKSWRGGKLLWLDEQTRALATVLVTTRTDVPADHVPEWEIPLESYVLLSGEEVDLIRRQVQDFAKEAFGIR